MDYKQKYEEALERCKKEFNFNNLAYSHEEIKQRLERVFTELKESEDEKIRKKVIEVLKFNINGAESQMQASKGVDRTFEVYACNKVIAWLEKQGEQKSADKIEPKFKVGDWITIDNPCQIISINGNYIVQYCDDEKTREISKKFCESQFHLWTIQDAKDGDMLAFDNGTIVIFKDLYNATTFHSYCHIENDIFNISKDDMPDWWERKRSHPATKEQRDILFQKMKEAGYEWDAEKKELKEIKQKPAWSEEDEKGFDDVLWAIEQAKVIVKDENDMGNIWFAEHWLKSLKERIKGE